MAPLWTAKAREGLKGSLASDTGAFAKKKAFRRRAWLSPVASTELT